MRVDRRSQKDAFSHVNDESSLVKSSIDSGHIFGGDVHKDRGILMLGKGPHKPLFAYDIVRIQSLMIHTDIVEKIIVGDTNAPLLRCFVFKSKVKSVDVITRGQ